MTKPQAFRKVGSMVCLGNNGFTVLENNKSYYLNNIILDHKTGQKMCLGPWAEMAKDNICLNSCSFLKQKFKTINFLVPVEFDPDYIATNDDYISAHYVLNNCMFKIFSMLICEGEAFHEVLLYVCSKIKELCKAYHETLTSLHGEIDSIYFDSEEIDKVIENFCPTADKIIEDFKSLGVEFKD